MGGAFSTSVLPRPFHGVPFLRCRYGLVVRLFGEELHWESSMYEAEEPWGYDFYNQGMRLKETKGLKL